MSSPQEAALRDLAVSMARALSASNGDSPLHLAHNLGLLSETAGIDDLAPHTSAGWIGIWEPKTEDGESFYQRSRAHFTEWSKWADVERIPRKGTRKRVVFLGESVARGYFYDPQFCPAGALQSLLERVEAPGGVEVVDLARTDLDGLTLANLLSSSLALEPDLIVLFAGNNWSRAPLLLRSSLERSVASNILNTQGVAGFKALLEDKLAGLFMSRLAGPLAQLSKRVPVVLMIPEFNLADWRSDGLVDAPWLEGTANQSWLRCLLAAQEAFAAGRFEEAADRARELIAIDRGTAASGYTILADCLRRQGAWDEARQMLEKARDAHSWEMIGQAPRPLAFLQQGLRRLATQGNIKLVDLPQIFSERLGGEVPDRRLFLDYCHLSAEGIRVAMAAAAEAASPLLGGRPVSRQELADVPLGPSAEAEAEARFGAALHNAHWGQSLELVRHHCDQAVAASRKVAEAMSLYAELQCLRAPAWMCAAGERLMQVADAGPLRRFLTYYMTYHRKVLDRGLVEAICSTLEEVGMPIRERITALLCQERGVAPGQPVDLISSYFRTSWINRDWMWTQSFYHRIHSPVSELSFVCDGSGPIELEIVCRRLVDPGAEDETCALSVNGALVVSFSPTAAWQTWRFSLSPDMLERGANRVEIRWPLRTIPGEEGIRQVARDIEEGTNYYMLTPVFAEIHSFTAAAPALRG